MTNKTPVYVVQHNHFDPVWHRCWDRGYDFQGKRYRSYSDLEEHIINIWLETAKSGPGFIEGQSAVFRKYLERHPDRLKVMQQLVKDGRIHLQAGGEVVSDTNIPSGETLLRNLVLGQRYFEDTFGVIPQVATVEDAFGHNAQLPQLFSGVECHTVAAIVRVKVPGEYWKGLDGSVVFTGGYGVGRYVGHCAKVPPCTKCDGMGCESCDDFGLDFDCCEIKDEDIMEALGADYTAGPFGLVGMGGEEAIPNPRLSQICAEAKEKFGVELYYHGAPTDELLAEAVAKRNNPNLEVSDQVESNPVFTGCYVSRIKLKQEMRRVENMLNTAERWATVAHLLGQEFPQDQLLDAWRNVVFVGFHDAITGTHMDQPYYELMDMLSEAECHAECVMENSFGKIEHGIAADPEKQYLIAYNGESWERNDPMSVTISGTCGVPELESPSGEAIEILDISAIGEDVDITFRTPVPALGYTVIEAVPNTRPIDSGEVTTGPGEVENEFFKIRVTDRGIDSIFDKCLGREILDTSKYLGNELILEDDFGDPWGTSKAPAFEEPLGRYTSRVRIRRAVNASEIVLTGQYKGSDENTYALTWQQSVILYKDSDRIDFRTEIDWDTAHRRIRVAFPTDIKTDEATYAIPYGAVKRSKYEPKWGFDVDAINGDWPAVNWVDVYSETENCGVALINTGTPSHKVEKGVIYMSLLRSPAEAWVLNEPEYYDCPDFDGSRDAGHHEFFYSLIPHAGDYRAAGIEKRGRVINNPIICRGLEGSKHGKPDSRWSFIELDATDNVIVTAIKKADRDNSVIVRLAETDGLSGEASVSLEKAGKKASLVNFLERHPEPVEGKIKLSPFKIVTVRLH